MSKHSLACEITGVWTQYGSTVIHRDLNLAVRTGEVMALVGGSGSGKTTLLRHIVGLTTPSRGEINLFGVNLAKLDREGARLARNRFGMLFQQGALFSALTVYDNIAFPLRELRQFDEESIHLLVMHKLALVELEPKHAWLLPAQLSGGMVKRVALARALALEPELLVLDEPTAGLDPDRSEKFVHLINNLKKQLGLTVVFVTHDLDTLVGMTDRVAVLADQHIIAACTLSELAHVDHPFAQNFFKGVHERLDRTDKWKTAPTH
ncbi:MAG: ATP-binding cassette domain-containing protein [Gallionella sp.]|nr:ATP-binding cassette domain-containing protein [Gallionella sp.]